jgi:hypothetical protein
MPPRKKIDPELVVWEPQPGPQTSLLTCPAWEIFYGGARGGGKSDGILGEFIGHAQQYAEGASALVVRRTRVELQDLIERSRQIYTPLGAKFNTTDSLWRFPNGARLQFIYLEQDSDADRYQGRSITRLYVEEAGTFPSEKPILKLFACVRSGKGVPTKVIMTGNPGGPGQQWIKARYIDPCPTGFKVFQRESVNPFTKEKLVRDWCFIPAKVFDNKFLGPDYVANIQMSGSPQWVQAMLMGDWNSVEGAFFNWDSQKHVIAPFDIPADWVRFRSMDWGFAAPFSVGWWAVVGDETHVRGGIDGSVRFSLPRGCLVRYREWYGAHAPGQGLKLTNQEIAEGIVRREKDDPRLSYGVLDPSAFADNGGVSIAEQINGIVCKAKLPPFRRADNKRVGGKGAISGWAQVRNRMRGDDEGNPFIACFNTCIDSIRTLPVLQHDPDKPEDLDTESEDHAADEWRYACMSRPFNRTKTLVKPKTMNDYVKHKEPPKIDGWVAF